MSKFKMTFNELAGIIIAIIFISLYGYRYFWPRLPAYYNSYKEFYKMRGYIKSGKIPLNASTLRVPNDIRFPNTPNQYCQQHVKDYRGKPVDSVASFDRIPYCLKGDYLGIQEDTPLRYKQYANRIYYLVGYDILVSNIINLKNNPIKASQNDK